MVDVRRLGLVANDPGAASSNAKALKSLVAPGGNFAGSICFTNVSGADVYHFDGIISFHDHVHIDLMGSTLRFHKVSESSDANSGFLFVMRDFQMENGSIVVDYDMARDVTSAGTAIHIGNRGNDSAYSAPTYDSQLTAPLGNVVLRNLRIVSNVVNGNAIEMTGGLSGVVLENIWIEGSGRLKGGVYYEFGWATPGVTNQRETSHAHEMQFTNINVANLNPSSGVAMTMAGAYNSIIDGLYVNGAGSAFVGTPGESLNFRPWNAMDRVGAKRTMVLRRLVASRLGATAIWLTGAQRSKNGYLAGPVSQASDQTDLADYSLDGFAIDGTSSGWGIHISANRVDIRNGRITGFQRGIVQSDDCTRIVIDSVDILASSQTAVQLHMGDTIWSPARQKSGEIRNCFIAGNSTKAAGATAAIELDNCAGFLIQNNRIGFEQVHDGRTESTQGNAIQLGEHCSRVLCIGNYVGGIGPGSIAYYNAAPGSDARGNTIQAAGGILTTHGAWEGITVRRQALEISSSVTFNAAGSEQIDILASSGANFAIMAPSNPVNDKTIYLSVRNSSSGQLGRVVWDPIFKMSPWTSPGAGYSRSIAFRFDGSHWVQIAQTGVDVPN